MPGHKLRWFTAGLFASAGAGMLSLTSMMNPAFAFGEPLPPADPDIGLFVGASGTPIPGPDYVGAAYELYVAPTYPGAITSFYQGTEANPLGNGVFTPEGLYPLESAGVHQLYLNYPLDANGLPALSSSVGQGAEIVQSTVLGEQALDNASTVFGYSQGSTLNGIAMQLLDPTGAPETGALDPKFLLIADPSNPNGGLLERFNGFETTSGQTTVDPLNLPSLGISFDGATPADDYTTSIYSLEYDGFADFPRYPLNFLSDLNAFLGIAELHGTYLNAAGGESGPSPTDIANAVHLTTDGATTTNYYMITTDTISGVEGPVTPPLVSTLGDLPVIGKPLEDLLGPDLTVLINLGYGGDNLGYSDAPANIATPFGLAPRRQLDHTDERTVRRCAERVRGLRERPVRSSCVVLVADGALDDIRPVVVGHLHYFGDRLQFSGGCEHYAYRPRQCVLECSFDGLQHAVAVDRHRECPDHEPAGLRPLAVHRQPRHGRPPGCLRVADCGEHRAGHTGSRFRVRGCLDCGLPDSRRLLCYRVLTAG